MLHSWKCCLRKFKDDEGSFLNLMDVTISGCCQGRHLEASSTSEVLREIDVLKFEKQIQHPNAPSSETPKEGLSGNLIKQGHIVKNWKQRFFKLEKETLSYYSDSSVLLSSSPTDF